ncbi:MAG: hypothetical protein RMJ87_11295 [Cytophagales bacterium]|nr:hypothetical protein [Bernardetiaceae bacterium]MDW8205604.1 hypothetical protein [Cytophagales bacterium]
MFLIQVILLAVVCAVFQMLLPGNAVYVVAAIALVFGLIFGQKPFHAFVMGLLGVGFLWGGYALWLDQMTDSILGSKVAVLFSLPNALTLALATGLIGGILGGFAALSGALIRKLIA